MISASHKGLIHTDLSPNNPPLINLDGHLTYRICKLLNSIHPTKGTPYWLAQWYAIEVATSCGILSWCDTLQLAL